MINSPLNEYIQKYSADFSDFRVRSVVADMTELIVKVEIVYPFEMKITDETKTKLNTCVSEFLSLNRWKIETVAVRSHYDDFSLKNFVADLLKNYPAVSSVISEENIRIENKKDIYLDCDDRIHNYIVAAQIEQTINNSLYANFCDTPGFRPRIVRKVTREELDAQLDTEKFAPEPVDTELRRIKVIERELYIGDLVEADAVYIKDIISEGDIVVCGVVSQKRDFVTREKQKPFFKFILTDPTGKIDVLLFPNKSTLEKAGKITDGETIILSGSVNADTFRNKSSYTVTARNISYCKMPSDFKEVIHFKPVPQKYTFVKPAVFVGEPQQMTLTDMLEKEKETPKYLRNKTFVVFDLETTGTDILIDKVTEICGIKITDGKLSEVFSTFIDPEVPIPREITELTGINDVMVAGKPKINDVVPDFYKFCDNAVLVAHNASFDMGFIKRFAAPLDYNFNHTVIDTLALARSNLKLSKYKLESLAEYYGFKNKGAHRALFDTEVLCYIFMNLCEFLND